METISGIVSVDPFPRLAISSVTLFPNPGQQQRVPKRLNAHFLQSSVFLSYSVQ